MRRIATALFLLTSSLIAAPGLAGGPRGPGGPHGPHGGPAGPELFLMERYAEQIGLDEAEIAAIRQAVRASHPEMMALHEEMRAARAKLGELLQQESPDSASVMAQAEVLNSLEGKMLELRLRKTLEIRGMLTPEQRAELVRILDEHRQAREQRRAERRQQLTEACAAETERFCGDGEAGGLGHGCLRDHFDELSDSCRDALRQHRRHRGHPGCDVGEGPAPPA